MANNYKSRKPKDVIEEAKKVPEEVEVTLDPEAPITKDVKEKKGKVVADVLNVRTAPVVGDNILCTINKGTEVAIFDIAVPEGWLNVSATPIDGVEFRGYVMAQFIEEVTV